MTDQTPRTEAGRRLLVVFENGDTYRDVILAIEAEAAAQARVLAYRDYVTAGIVPDWVAQARTETLDVEVLVDVMRENGVGINRAHRIAARYRAILAGETE